MMSMIYAERLIEYAIRCGTQDLIDEPENLDILFFTDKKLREGADLTPTGQTEKVTEPLLMDYFQERIAGLPRTKAETGVAPHDVFKNSIPQLPDIKEYLKESSVKIVHGFPHESNDLPCISITLGNEDEMKYLGGIKATIDGKNQRFRVVGSDWNAQYNIQVITPNYDETVIWYHIIKFALLKYRHALEAYGMRNQSMSWNDPEPAPEYLQAGVFVYTRACTLACERADDFPVEEKGFNKLFFGVNAVTTDQNGQIIPDPVGQP